MGDENVRVTYAKRAGPNDAGLAPFGGLGDGASAEGLPFGWVARGGEGR
jgi:hypothetical protein